MQVRSECHCLDSIISRMILSAGANGPGGFCSIVFCSTRRVKIEI